MAWTVHKSFVAIGALAFFAVAPEASAQTNPSPLTISSWIKSCSQYSFAYQPSPSRCRVSRDVYKGGELIGSFLVFVANMPDPKMFFIVSVRRDVALQSNALLTVDGDQPLSTRYINCASTTPPGDRVAHCFEAGPDVLARLKTGQVLKMQAIQKNGQSFSMQIDLKEFATVYDGPPTDLKVLADQQIKLQSEPQKPIRDDTLQRHLRPNNY